MPCLPAVAHRVLELLGRQGDRRSDITDLILLDPSLTLRILGAAERLTSKIGCRVQSVGMAVQILGVSSLQKIVREQIETAPAPTLEDMQTVRHGVISGLCAASIAAILGHGSPEQARAAGLLEDLAAGTISGDESLSFHGMQEILGRGCSTSGIRRNVEDNVRTVLFLADRMASELGAPSSARRSTDGGTVHRMRSLGESVYGRVSNEVADTLVVLGLLLGIPNLTIANFAEELCRIGDLIRERTHAVGSLSPLLHQAFHLLRGANHEGMVLRQFHMAVGRMPQVAGAMLILDESGEAVIQESTEERPFYFTCRDLFVSVDGLYELCQSVQREGHPMVIDPSMGFDGVFSAFTADALLLVPLQAAQRPLGILVVVPHENCLGVLREHLAPACGALADATGRVLERIQLGRRSFLLTERITKDAHTGLLQRAHFMELFESEIRTANRYHRPLALVMLDVDHFKLWNDTYGHQVGDSLLKDLARVLKDCTRDGDLVGRYGGDEFLILLPGQGVEQAKAFAERLRSRVESFSQVMAGVCYELTLSISVGVAAIASYPADAGSILFRADHALYRAKEGGRNRVHAELPDS